MEEVEVIADTGPLIAFAKIDRLDLLSFLFGAILIPPAVEHELTAKRSAESWRLQSAIGGLLHVTEQPEFLSEVKIATVNLDMGEAAAIALAYNFSLGLIVDDKLGRRSATRLKIPVLGSAGIVLEAKRRGRLPLVTPVLLELQRAGYWISDELIYQIAEIAGENDTASQSRVND